MKTLVSTSDKDLAQLVDEDVTLVNTLTGTVLDASGVVAKFGVPPARIADWLSLVGDSSDNIPGLPKCGPKTATRWLAEFGDLDTLKARAGEVGSKIGDSLRANVDLLQLSRRLSTIRCDVKVKLTPAELARREPDSGKLRMIYVRLEFNSLLRKLPKGDVGDAGASGSADPPQHDAADYETVLTVAQLDGWLEHVAEPEEFALDTETDRFDYMRVRIVGVSFAVEPDRAAYVPLAHRDPDAPRAAGYRRHPRQTSAIAGGPW